MSKRTSMKVGACTLRVSQSGWALVRPTGSRLYPEEMVAQGVARSKLDGIITGIRYGLEDSPFSCGFDPVLGSQPLAERERVRGVLTKARAALRRSR